MFVPLIQAYEQNLQNILLQVDKSFQNSGLESGCVLIQKCEKVKIELKSQKIRTIKQKFVPTENEGAYIYRAGMD